MAHTHTLPQIRYRQSHELPRDPAAYVWDFDHEDDGDGDGDDSTTWTHVRIAPARCLAWDQQLTGGADAPLNVRLPGLEETCEGAFDTNLPGLNTEDAVKTHMAALGFVHVPGVFEH
jgi:hypothetical protein